MSSTFSIKGRAAPGLYFAAWTLSLAGALTTLVGFLSVPPFRVPLLLAGLAGLVLGLATAAGYQVLSRARRPDRAYRGPSPPILLGVSVLVTILMAFVVDAAVGVDPDRPLGFLVSLVLIAIVYLAVIMLFVVRTGALRWTEMGWPARSRIGDAIVSGTVAVVIMIPATFAVLIFAGIVGTLLDVDAPTQLPTANTSLDRLLLLLAAAVVAPVGEEAFFRGFAQTAWQRDLGPRRALVRSALFFAAVHIANVTATRATASEGARQALLQFVVILPVGFVLGWLFQQRGIAASIAGHVTYNGLLLLLVFLVARTAPVAPGA